MCPHKCSAHKKCVPKNVCKDLFFIPLWFLFGPPEIVSKLIYDRAQFAQNLETQREAKGPGVYTLRLSQLFYTINNKPDHKTLYI